MNYTVQSPTKKKRIIRYKRSTITGFHDEPNQTQTKTKTNQTIKPNQSFIKLPTPKKLLHIKERYHSDTIWPIIKIFTKPQNTKNNHKHNVEVNENYIKEEN